MARAQAVALVTGARGFIGRRLVSRLVESGWNVVALIRSANAIPESIGARPVVADLLDVGALQDAVRGVDAVFHLGAINSAQRSCEAPDEVFRVNALGTLNILEASRLDGVGRFVQISSAHVYGPVKCLPVNEDHPLNPQTPYAASKAAAEHLALSYRRTFGLGVAVLRVFNCYGPGQSSEAVVAGIVQQAAAGGPVGVADDTIRRDFVFVDDVVEAIVKAATVPAAVGGVFNIGSGEDVSLAEIIRRAEALAGITSKSGSDVALPVSRDRMVCDNGRAAAVLGWTPRTSIEQGLAATLAASRLRPAALYPMSDEPG